MICEGTHFREPPGALYLTQKKFSVPAVVNVPAFFCCMDLFFDPVALAMMISRMADTKGGSFQLASTSYLSQRIQLPISTSFHAGVTICTIRLCFGKS